MIFSILAFIALIISICVKERKLSLTLQSLDCLFEAIYDFTISAYTAAVLSIFNTIRTFLFINKKRFSQLIYLIILVVFEIIIVVNCIFTWHGPISLLPTVGSIFRTYCLWQINMKLIRISGITSGILYSLYYVLYSGWFMALGYFILLVMSIYSIYKYDYKKAK